MAFSALENVVATEHQMRSERRICFVLGSPRLPCGRRAKSSFEESGRSIRRKRRISSAIEREGTRLLDGHGDRHAWRLWVSGPSNGRMVPKIKRTKWEQDIIIEKEKEKEAVQSLVARKGQGSCSNQPELAEIFTGAS